MKAIFQIVEEETGFSQNDLQSKRVGKYISRARQITAYILYDTYNHHIDEICMALKRERNSVYYMIEKVQNYEELTDECDLYVEILEKCPENSDVKDQDCRDLLNEAVAILIELKSKRIYTKEARDMKSKANKFIEKVRGL